MPPASPSPSTMRSRQPLRGRQRYRSLATAAVIVTLAAILAPAPVRASPISLGAFSVFSAATHASLSQVPVNSGDQSELEISPLEPVESGSSGGWLSRWLSLGGEGSVTVFLDEFNLTLPHRPAAFPTHLAAAMQLPLTGLLVPFTSLPPLSPESISDAEYIHKASTTAPPRPIFACLAPAWPPIRPRQPHAPYTIALIERGGCDFATKVRAAQERGAAGVIVGDTVIRASETDEEGRHRENLITMFSPEDTSGIIIPSVYVSRASYLALRDLLDNHTLYGSPGLYVELGEAEDDGNALGSLLTFALLMPSLFLLATIAAHRVRVARQREANRAPPLVVFSLPERIWTPDIVWEKDDSDESGSDKEPDEPETEPEIIPEAEADTGGEDTPIPAPPPISPREVRTPPPIDAADEEPLALAAVAVAVPSSSRRSRRRKQSGGKDKVKERRKSGKRYFSKDECAICMDSFMRGDVVRILPCGHVFHKDECDEWLLKWRKLCPTCRADVTMPADDLASSTMLTPVVAPVVAVDESNVAGAGVNDGEEGEDGDDQDQHSWFGRAAAALRSAREWAGFTRDDTLDERTPLVRDHVDRDDNAHQV